MGPIRPQNLNDVFWSAANQARQKLPEQTHNQKVRLLLHLRERSGSSLFFLEWYSLRLIPIIVIIIIISTFTTMFFMYRLLRCIDIRSSRWPVGPWIVIFLIKPPPKFVPVSMPIAASIQRRLRVC
jgi:hypothetical protein